jgi:hypothetical protein
MEFEWECHDTLEFWWLFTAKNKIVIQSELFQLGRL